MDCGSRGRISPSRTTSRSVQDTTEPNCALNDWSFSQLCSMAGVQKGTVNRLSCKTASNVFDETLPRDGKPLQILSTNDVVRSIHGDDLHTLVELPVARCRRRVRCGLSSAAESDG